MPKKLTKDQKYNRKRRKDGNKDFRRVPTGPIFDARRVTRKQITFYISHEAAERLQQMADDAGIFKWEMASRIILKGLPGIERSGYATLRNSEAINPYEWNVLYLEPVIKKIHYRSGKADKRVTIDVTSTAWNKIHCHSTAAEALSLQARHGDLPEPGLMCSARRKRSLGLERERLLKSVVIPVDLLVERPT